MIDFLSLKLSGNSIVSYVNPITRTVIRLDPPFPFNNDNLDEVEQLCESLAGFCVSAWETTNRRDPQMLDPYKVLDGREPIDSLEDLLTDLLKSYGLFAVASALARLEPTAVEAVMSADPLLTY